MPSERGVIHGLRQTSGLCANEYTGPSTARRAMGNKCFVQFGHFDEALINETKLDIDKRRQARIPTSYSLGSRMSRYTQACAPQYEFLIRLYSVTHQQVQRFRIPRPAVLCDCFRHLRHSLFERSAPALGPSVFGWSAAASPFGGGRPFPSYHLRPRRHSSFLRL